MKKIVKNLTVFILILGVVFVVFACAKGDTQKEVFSISYVATEGGFIDGENAQSVEKGKDTSEVTAVAHDGYVFYNWSDGFTNYIRQDQNVQSNISVTANFVIDIDSLEKFTVQYSADEGGYISGQEAQLVAIGFDASSVTAIPYAGYDFVSWSDGKTTGTRQDNDIRQDASFTAQFQRQTLEVQYTAGENGRIEGDTSQTVVYGSSATLVTAIPDLGYRFVRWSDTKSTNPSRTSDNITDNINAIAEFDYVLADGSGTENNPRTIASYQQLLDIRRYPNLYYKLVSDLDLSGENHEPIFSNTNAFIGVFDGNGYTIKNMTINTYTAYPSLFGFVDSGVIKNLNVIDFQIIVPNYNTSASALCVGAVAGKSFGALDNIFAKGTITGSGFTYDGVAIGGLVGQANGLITNCKTDIGTEIDNVTRIGNSPQPFNIGGLVGVSAANIYFSETTGRIYVAQVHDEVLIGGLVGYFFANGTDILTSSLEINDCVTNIEITNGNDSFANSGGLIAKVIIYFGELKIENCAVYGDISNGGLLGGFICNISSYTSLINIVNCHVLNDILINSGAAGFIFQISNIGIAVISNSYSKGNIIANAAAGFCYVVNDDVVFNNCFSERNIQAMALTAGFIFQIVGGVVEECFATGTVTITHQGAGFINYINGTTIKNCYSTSDIYVTNTDPDSQMRTMVGGFVFSAKNSNLINCYYSGKISGFVYTTSNASGFGSIVGAFIGIANNSQMINCHVLYPSDTFAMDVIVEYYYMMDEYIDLTIYETIEEMSSLTHILNDGLDEPKWAQGDNGLPQLCYICG